MLWALTFAVFGLWLCEEAADSVWGYGEGDARCHFQSVDAYHVAILKEIRKHVQTYRAHSQFLMTESPILY